MVIAICFSMSLLRLAFIITDEKITTVAHTQSKKSVVIGHSRGTIYDCKGRRLTNCDTQYFACVPPSAKAVNAVRKYLSPEQENTLKSGYPVAVEVDKNFKSDKVEVVSIPRRYSRVAAHLIGYVDSLGKGVSGLEKGYDKLLCGEKIKVTFDIDATGAVIANSQIADNLITKQKGLKLTIDKSFQSVCENALQDKCGAVVVLDNKTAKIKALCSSPTFSQYAIADALENENSPFVFRAISGYNCGSVFKLCVAACALNNGIDLKYECRGKIDVDGATFSCINAHGAVGMKEALAVSCNCYFVRLAQKVGAKNLLEFTKNLGFGSSLKLASGIECSSGVLPTLKQLKNPTTLANFSFGQGSLLATPLQIASVIQTICNDGKYVLPSLIEGECDVNGALISSEKQNLPTYILSKPTANTLLEYMVNAVQNGTGKGACVKNAKVGGKTATAQTGIYNAQGKNIYQTWFGGFLKCDSGDYTIVVMVEDGSSGSKDCLPIFQEIAKSISQN